MYEYAVVNEHSDELLFYAHTLADAQERTKKDAVKYGSQRLSIWKRTLTYETKRAWK